MKKQNKKFNKKILRLGLVSMIPLCLGLGIGAYYSVVSGLPPAESISFFAPPISTKVFDDQGNVISQFFIERRELTSLDRVPQYLKDGFISIEDKRFYSHWGVDMLRFFKSMLINVVNMHIVQGGSTITMQLARNMFLTMEQTIMRKLKEMALAIRIERAFTKDEILEMYLNQINFGQGHYGVATAAEYYFDKDISELNLTECALLVALPKGEGYSPYKRPERAIQRRDLVLKAMLDNKVISSEDYTRAVNEPLGVVEQKKERRVGEYFLEEIRRYLELKYGPEFLYRSGANIYTTMNTRMQKVAEEVLEKHLTKLEKDQRLPHPKSEFDSIGLADTITAIPYLQGAFVLLNYHTGEVKAMIGGRNFTQSQFNRATQARRQAGSAFKIFVFTAAVDNGFTPTDIVLDLPIVLEIPGMDSIYRPSNYDRTFLGPITVKNALKHSRNLVAIRLIRSIGPELVVSYAHNLGVASPLLPVVSLALGACEVNLLEMVSAAGTIADLGERVEPIMIRKITDNDGTLIEINNPLPERRISAQTSYIMTDIMKSVVNGGTGYRVREFYKGNAAGKTGTTNNYSDAWFIGYTPEYACGVWVGYDNNDRIFRGATGGFTSAPIWGDFMARIDTLQNKEFPRPSSGLSSTRICSQTGLLARPSCPEVIDQVYIEGTEPTELCDTHVFRDRFRQYEEEFEKIDESIIEGY
ncbi:MAG: PBP1A family penicillin-binding protein [candidate division WOR-3 bacterium]|nr:PBP1A family penicillin-binding protein [candidate division WOR-3 bacterium]